MAFSFVYLQADENKKNLLCVAQKHMMMILSDQKTLNRASAKKIIQLGKSIKVSFYNSLKEDVIEDIFHFILIRLFCRAHFFH